MSKGTTHVKACTILSFSFAGAAILSGRTELYICSAGALTGVLLSGDLDVDAGNISNFIVRKRVGWFGERLWRWFWRGYSSSFKHRQFASHFPIFGTFVRLSYIYFFIVFIPAIFLKFGEVLISDLVQFTNLNLTLFLISCAKIIMNLYFFIGLASSDFIHWALDKLTTNAE